MFGSLFSSVDISTSGLSAERLRMEVIATNIANAQTTRMPDGNPYRRQQVVFAAQMDQLNRGQPNFGGVRVVDIQADPTEFPRIRNENHPHADANGMLALPNVQLPTEMVDLVTSSRAYEANLRAIRNFLQMAQKTIALIRENT